MPVAPSSGTPRESQAKFRDGTVWGLQKGPVGTGPAGSVFRGNSVYQETRGTRGVVVCLNVVLSPGVVNPEVKILVRDLVPRYCCPLCPTGGAIFGDKSFFEPQGVNGHRRPVPGAPSSATPRESQAKFRDGTIRGLKKGSVCTGHAGSIFGENSFCQEIRGTRLGGRRVA